MKVQLTATQLTDAAIEKVSLVKHGANRTPFKILKAAALPPDGSLDGVAAKVRKFFGDKAPLPKITAVYVNKAVAKQAIPVIKDAGFRAEPEHAAIMGDCLVLKQEGFDPEAEDGSVVVIDENTAVQFDRVVKGFCSWELTTDFSTNLQRLGFYPGVRLALDALLETIYPIMGDAHTSDEASSQLDAALKAFTKHVMGLAKSMPAEVFKMEEKLATGFEGHTVAAVAPISKTEGTDMKNTNLREAVAGDLAGLFDTVTKTEAAADASATANANAPAADATATAEVTDAAAETTAEADAAAAAAAASAAEAAAAGGDGGGEEEVKKGDEIVKAIEKLAGVMTAIKTDLDALKTQGDATNASLTTVTDRLNAVEKAAADAATVAKTAVAKADNTVTVVAASADYDFGSTLHSLHNGQTKVQKTEQPVSVFKGLFPQLDALQERMNSGGETADTE